MIPEPWLRGPQPGVNTLLAPILRALEQAAEDLPKHAESLSDAELWSQPRGLAPLGFHLQHIAGSLDRLTTYLQGGQLNDAQFTFLHAEMNPSGTMQQILQAVSLAIERACDAVRAIDPGTLTAPRTVGRNHLPTTVIGLAIHLAEHTQRHVGQAITTCNLLKAVRRVAR